METAKSIEDEIERARVCCDRARCNEKEGRSPTGRCWKEKRNKRKREGRERKRERRSREIIELPSGDVSVCVRGCCTERRQSILRVPSWRERKKVNERRRRVRERRREEYKARPVSNDVISLVSQRVNEYGLSRAFRARWAPAVSTFYRSCLPYLKI